jgi:hypothetical protein
MFVLGKRGGHTREQSAQLSAVTNTWHIVDGSFDSVLDHQ